jgi:hypothetical protein
MNTFQESIKYVGIFHSELHTTYIAQKHSHFSSAFIWYLRRSVRNVSRHLSAAEAAFYNTLIYTLPWECAKW